MISNSAADPERLAALHALGFPATEQHSPRAWTAAEFRVLLSHPAVFVLLEGPSFLLGRTVIDEAELLTLTTPPVARRRGHARRLMVQFDAYAKWSGAGQAFLEVAATNRQALRLYESSGWTQAGLRRRYYGPNIDAIVMKKVLTDTRSQGTVHQMPDPAANCLLEQQRDDASVPGKQLRVETP